MRTHGNTLLVSFFLPTHLRLWTISLTVKRVPPLWIALYALNQQVSLNPCEAVYPMNLRCLPIKSPSAPDSRLLVVYESRDSEEIVIP